MYIYVRLYFLKTISMSMGLCNLVRIHWMWINGWMNNGLLSVLPCKESAILPLYLSWVSFCLLPCKESAILPVYWLKFRATRTRTTDFGTSSSHFIITTDGPHHTKISARHNWQLYRAKQVNSIKLCSVILSLRSNFWYKSFPLT